VGNLSFVKNCVKLFSVLVILLLLSGYQLKAQYAPGYNVPDSTFLQKHSPLKATFYSALVPGLGQVYNQKYWKVPIIYAGFTGLAYYAGYNNFVYKKYRDAYNIKYKIEELGDTTLTDKYSAYSLTSLGKTRDNWQRYRDLCYIGISLLYVAQIIDANVDAHLFDYDISEDLTLNIRPTIAIDPRFAMITQNKTNTTLGLRCTFRFR